jgi:hypothetical protein
LGLIGRKRHWPNLAISGASDGELTGKFPFVEIPYTEDAIGRCGSEKASALREDAGTIEEVYEPFLIKEGYIKRTPRGREVTPHTYKHLGKFKAGHLPLQFE